MRGHSLSASALGRSPLTLSLHVLWEGILGPASRRGHGERFGRSRGTGNLETTFLSAPHKSCSSAGLLSGESRLVLHSLACSFIRSFTRSFIYSTNVEAGLLLRWVLRQWGSGHASSPGVPCPKGRLVRSQQARGVRAVAGGRARKTIKVGY